MLKTNPLKEKIIKVKALSEKIRILDGLEALAREHFLVKMQELQNNEFYPDTLKETHVDQTTLKSFDNLCNYLNKLHYIYPLNLKNTQWVTDRFREFLLQITLEAISRLYMDIRDTKIDGTEKD